MSDFFNQTGCKDFLVLAASYYYLDDSFYVHILALQFRLILADEKGLTCKNDAGNSLLF